MQIPHGRHEADGRRCSGTPVAETDDRRQHLHGHLPLTPRLLVARGTHSLGATLHLRHRLGAIIPFVNEILDAWQTLPIDIHDPSDYSAVVYARRPARSPRGSPCTRKKGWHDVFLPRLVGMAKAKELIFMACPVEATEAERIGPVNRVVPHAELEMTTMKLTRQLAESATAAIGLAKTIMHRSAELNFHAFLRI